MTLNTEDLKKNVYDKVIDKICTNVLEVCKEQEPKAFFLFGKFSNSDYLYERLKTVVDEIIVIPEKDVSAAQGAVFHGLSEPLSIQRMTPIHEEKNQLKGAIDGSYYDFSYEQYTHVIGIGRYHSPFYNRCIVSFNVYLFVVLRFWYEFFKMVLSIGFSWRTSCV